MHAAQLARALGAKRSGRQWVCRCPAHEDSQPSLIFWDGHTSIRFKCFSGCEPQDIIDALEARGLWDGARTHERDNNSCFDGRGIGGHRKANGGSGLATPTPMADKNGSRSNQDFALALWRAAETLIGSPGEWYLNYRGLTVSALRSGVARFHPACPRSGDRAPAVIVLMRSIFDGAPCAIQRIFIRDGVKDGKPMMLGPAGNAAMKLAPKGPTLTICEGFETGLWLQSNGHAPVWALGSAGALARFPLLDGIDQLTVAYDRDPAGKRAFWEVYERWGAQRAKPFTVDREGADFADIARERRR